MFIKKYMTKKISNTIKDPKTNRIFKSEFNNNSISISKEQNTISNRNILKGQKINFQNQHSNPFPYSQVVSPKRRLFYNIPGTELKKNSHINLINEINKNIKNEEINDININDEDPNDKSIIDKDIETEQKYGDQNLYDFINNLIKENPLSELDNKKDIGEMIIYTKDIISQLLDYQIKFYDILKKSVEMNHKFNELLLKYNEKYRLIIKKMDKLKEENNTFDIKSDIINNNNKNDKNNIKENITIKNKELEIFKNIYKIENEENDINYDNNNNPIELKILLNALQKISSKYGSLTELITNKNTSEDEINNINYLINKYKDELSLNVPKSNIITNTNEEIKINDETKIENEKKNDNSRLEYVLNDNPDELDIILNKNLNNIYNNNKNVSRIIFKRVGKNNYEYGRKKIVVKKDDNNIKVRFGGLFTTLEKFIESISGETGKNSSIQTKLQNKSKDKANKSRDKGKKDNNFF